MIAFDGSPLVYGPPSVARMLRAWLAGWPAGDEPWLLLPSGSRVPGVDGARVHLDDRPSATPARFRARLPALVTQVGADALVSPWMAVPDLRGQGVPVIAMIHELPFVRLGPVEGRVRAWKHRLWLRRDLRRCAALLVPSDATRADVERLQPAAAPLLHLVPHGVDAARWTAARPAPAHPPYAIMTGVGRGAAHARKKGLDVLFEAWTQQRPVGWRLLLVGEPALPVPAGAGIDVRGSVPDEELPALVARASMLIYPSRMEGFGFPPLEAMAAGVPVVTTDAGSLPGVVGDAAHVVPAGEAAALAEGVGQVAEDDALRTRLITRGLERVRMFTPEASAGALRACLASLGVPA